MASKIKCQHRIKLRGFFNKLSDNVAYVVRVLRR